MTMTNLRRLAVWIFIGAVAAWVGVARPAAQTAESQPLELEAKIPLGDVAGRIDHLAVDLSRQRLFVAELGNDSVAVVDLNARNVRHIIAGLKAPQGIGYLPSSDMVFVASRKIVMMRRLMILALALAGPARQGWAEDIGSEAPP